MKIDINTLKKNAFNLVKEYNSLAKGEDNGADRITRYGQGMGILILLAEITGENYNDLWNECYEIYPAK